MGVEGGGRRLGIARNLRCGALGVVQQRAGLRQLGRERLTIPLRLVALLPFHAGPHAGAEAEREARRARCDRVQHRLGVGDHAHAGQGRPAAHGHTALPGHPAAM